MDFLIIALIIVGVIVLGLAALAILAWKKPEKLAPVFNFLRRNKKFKDVTDDAMAKQLARDPEMLVEQARSVGGAKAAKEMERSFANLSEEQRERKLRETLGVGEGAPGSGLGIDPSRVDITNAQQTLDRMREKPKTADQLRAQNKKKSAARKKSKSAKAQRKRSRKR